MARAQLANNASTTLSAAITDTGATTFTVASAASFPAVTTGAGTYFYCTLIDTAAVPEIVKVTNISGTTFTCTRAQDGTSARTFLNGATVSLRLVAVVFSELVASGDLGANVATFLATPTLANLNSAVSDADVAIRGANTFVAAQTLSTAASQNLSRVTVASHATTGDIWAAGHQIDWTGTATTTIFPNAPQAGAERVLICAGACAFTAGANMLIDGVASAATVTCAAGDQVIVRAVTTTQFKLSRVKYDGTAQVSTPSAMTLLSTVTASSSATVDIETTFSSTYDEYLIVATGVTLAADNKNLYVQMKVGGAYDEGSNYNCHISIPDSSSAAYASVVAAAATIIYAASLVGNAAGKTLNLQMKVHHPSSTSLMKTVDFTGSYVNTAGAVVSITGAGENTATTALTGIRFSTNATSIVSGTFRLYGIANS